MPTRLLISILRWFYHHFHDAGYINKELETIVGLQTDAPLKRAMLPNGGIRMVENSCAAYDRAR